MEGSTTRRRTSLPGGTFRAGPRIVGFGVIEPPRPTLRQRLSSTAERVPEHVLWARGRFPSADVGFLAFERELQFGGGLLAGGLAYRLFLWLLPLGLVGAELLGFWLDADKETVEDAAKEFGIGAASVASAAKAVEASQTNRILLLLFGLGVLAWFSLGFVRALQLAYALAWGIERPRLRRPLHAVAIFNGLFLLAAAGSAALAWLRETLGLGGLLGVAGTLSLQTGIALVVMWLLPRRAERWRELLPGALLVAVGAQVVGVAVVYYFAPKLERSSEIYGALGSAAVLLVWLYILARLITSAAFLNATLWERRQASIE